LQELIVEQKEKDSHQIGEHQRDKESRDAGATACSIGEAAQPADRMADSNDRSVGCRDRFLCAMDARVHAAITDNPAYT